MTRLTEQQIENLPEWMMIPDFPSYEVNCRAGLVRNVSNLRVLKSSLDSNGYPSVRLCKDGKGHTKNVHRLVANASFSFYNISTAGLDVCHLDEERGKPRISNLALGTSKENMNFPKAKQRCSESHKGEKGYWFGKRLSEETRLKMSEANKGKRLSEETRKKLSDAKPKKAVAAYKDGVLTLIFNSLKLVNVYGFNTGLVCSCCKGRKKTYKGYQWRYF